VDTDPIPEIDAYLHAAPLSGATAIEVGPFTLFRSTAAWPYYARPRPGVRSRVTAADLARLRTRCAELDLPLRLEWLTATAPDLAGVAERAGLTVTGYPLLAVDPAGFRPAPAGADVRVAPAELEPLLAARAVADLGFGHVDGAVGPAGPAERDARRRELRERRPDIGASLLDRARRGVAVTVTGHAAEVDPAGGPVASGVLHPVGPVAEVVGVATLPVARRRGLAAAVTSALTAHAFDHGGRLVLLSAQDERVARIYRGLGYTALTTAGAAE
jgi:GNAT superfamily N-acetyltransferase